MVSVAHGYCLSHKHAYYLGSALIRFECFLWYLASTGNERRLRWVCQSLLRPDDGPSNEPSETDQIQVPMQEERPVHDTIRKNWAAQVCQIVGSDGRSIIEKIAIPAIVRSQKAQNLIEELHDMLAVNETVS